MKIFIPIVQTCFFKFSSLASSNFQPYCADLLLQWISFLIWAICLFEQVIPMVLIWYRAFLLNPLKVDSFATSHFLHCAIPYASPHKHQLTSAFITLIKSVGIQYNLECILDKLVAINCFHGPLLHCYLLETYIALHHLIHLIHISHPVGCQMTPLCGANSHWLCCANCYLGKPPLIIYGPLGSLLLTITIPCEEGNQLLSW
jgi:hypothetical protein